MGKNGARDGNFIELGGWEIRKVRDGLDETQVASLINEFISQRDELTRRTEHLSSLTRLAERTVTEADKLAEEMKAEATEQAKAEAASIITQATAKAQQIEAEAKSIKLELRDSMQELFGQLLSRLENLKQQVEELQAESERRLYQPENKVNPVAAKVEVRLADSQEATPSVSPRIAEGPTEKTPVSRDQAMPVDEEKLDLELEIMPPLDIMKIMDIVTYLDNLPEVENTELIPNTERPSIVVSLREPIDLMGMLKTLPEIARVEEGRAKTTSEGNLPKLQISLSGESVTQRAK